MGDTCSSVAAWVRRIDWLVLRLFNWSGSILLADLHKQELVLTGLFAEAHSLQLVVNNSLNQFWWLLVTTATEQYLYLSS